MGGGCGQKGKLPACACVQSSQIGCALPPPTPVGFVWVSLLLGPLPSLAPLLLLTHCISAKGPVIRKPFLTSTPRLSQILHYYIIIYNYALYIMQFTCLPWFKIIRNLIVYVIPAWAEVSLLPTELFKFEWTPNTISYDSPNSSPQVLRVLEATSWCFSHSQS